MEALRKVGMEEAKGGTSWACSCRSRGLVVVAD